MERIETRALGAFLGLFVGDAFGAQTEFEMEKDIKQEHPNGFREMDSRERNIGDPGAVTDDSEMAIMLAKSIIAEGRVDANKVRQEYIRWLDALPSDLGTTIYNALRNNSMNPQSQANGALMRVAPIGIFGAKLDEEKVIAYSDADCGITHIHDVCRDANRLWALSMAKTIREGLTAQELYNYLLSIAPQITQEESLLEVVKRAKDEAPLSCDGEDQGWVLIAVQLSLYTLLHAPNIEEGIIEITMRGGDADTNAAIYGMLAGAVEGVDAIPKRWIDALRPTRCLEDLLGDDAFDLNQLAQTLVRGLLPF